MRKTIPLLTLCFLVLQATVYPQVPKPLPVPSGRGVLFARLADTPNADSVLVVNSSEGQTDWFLLRVGGNLKIDPPPETMSSVDEIKISPDGRFLAVASHGEGHPVIDVFDLNRLVEEKKPEALVSLNPYPGSITLGQWTGGKLLVRSDRLLTHKGKDGWSLPLDDFRLFAVDPTTGRISARSLDIRDPEGYYLARLSSPDHLQKMEAVESLVVLKSAKAVPRLQKMMMEESDAETRERISAAIVELRAGR